MIFNFALFANKGTGYVFLKALVENKLIPTLVITQTPGEAYLGEKGLKKIFKYIKLKLSILAKKDYYVKTFDVYYLCKNENIPVLSSFLSNTKELIRLCALYDIKKGIVFTFEKILKKNIIDSFENGIINFHPSLLPSHRGQDPVFWTIYNEDKIAGITIHLINEKIDKGEVLFRKKYDVKETDDVLTLNNNLMKSGIDELIYYLEEGKFGFDNPIDYVDDIPDSYDPPVSGNIFLINSNTDSIKLKKMFKAVFSQFRPHIIINDEKVFFKKYEEIIDFNLCVSSGDFLLKQFSDSVIIVTIDKKIFKLFR